MAGIVTVGRSRRRTDSILDIISKYYDFIDHIGCGRTATLKYLKDVNLMTASGLRYKRNENFVSRRIENETVLVPIKDNLGDMSSIYRLNEVAAFIWQNINCKNSISDIKKLIISEFAITETQAIADLNEFVRALEKIEAIGPVSSCPNCQCQ